MYAITDASDVDSVTHVLTNHISRHHFNRLCISWYEDIRANAHEVIDR